MSKKAPTRSKERSRRQICEAALECYAEQGATRVTLAEIAKRAGVPPPLIHYHFAEPTSLFRGVVDLILEDLRASVTAPIARKPPSPVRLLEDYADAYFDWMRAKPRLFAVWLHFYYVSAVDPEFRALNSVIRVAGRDRLAAILYEGLESRAFRLPRGCDVRQAALEIQSCITGGCVMAATEDGLTLKAAAEATRRQVRRLVGG